MLAHDVAALPEDKPLPICPASVARTTVMLPQFYRIDSLAHSIPEERVKIALMVGEIIARHLAHETRVPDASLRERLHQQIKTTDTEN